VLYRTLYRIYPIILNLAVYDRNQTLHLHIQIVNWLGSLAVTSFFLALLQHVGGAGTFWTLSLITIVGTAFIYYCVPETHQVTLSHTLLHNADTRSCNAYNVTLFLDN
jgi:Sugar (and other) transporter